VKDQLQVDKSRRSWSVINIGVELVGSADLARAGDQTGRIVSVNGEGGRIDATGHANPHRAGSKASAE
jgi:hypothetical protein